MSTSTKVVVWLLIIVCSFPIHAATSVVEGVTVSEMKRALWNGEAPKGFADARLNKHPDDELAARLFDGLKLQNDGMTLVVTSDKLVTRSAHGEAFGTRAFADRMFGEGFAILWAKNYRLNSLSLKSSMIAFAGQDSSSDPPNSLITFFRGRNGRLFGVFQSIELHSSKKCDSYSEEKHWKCVVENLSPQDKELVLQKDKAARAFFRTITAR
jgi:hypothetical protein